MQKIMPPIPKAYNIITAAILKTLITTIVDPSGGIPSRRHAKSSNNALTSTVLPYQAIQWMHFPRLDN